MRTPTPEELNNALAYLSKLDPAVVETDVLYSALRASKLYPVAGLNTLAMMQNLGLCDAYKTREPLKPEAHDCMARVMAHAVHIGMCVAELRQGRR